MKACWCAAATCVLVIGAAVVAVPAYALGAAVAAYVELDCASPANVVVSVVNSGTGTARVTAELDRTDGSTADLERVNLDAGSSQDIGLGYQPDGVYLVHTSISGSGEVLLQTVEVDCVDDPTASTTPAPSASPRPTSTPTTTPTPTSSGSKQSVTIPSGTCPTVTGLGAGEAPVYRFWSPVYQGHFYTISAAECRQVVATMPDLWHYEGIAFHAFTQQASGTVPLYRFFSTTFHGHFYTVNQAERDHVIATMSSLWSYEGVAAYVYPPDSTQPASAGVYRFWSPSAKHHFYTASTAERDNVQSTLSNLWTYESEAFRVPTG